MRTNLNDKTKYINITIQTDINTLEFCIFYMHLTRIQTNKLAGKKAQATIYLSYIVVHIYYALSTDAVFC